MTHVSLYKNGIGFFEHQTQVSGNQTVMLGLTSAQLDDVLQTLTVIDLGGGRITGASYNSTTPLEQQLQALPLSLGQEPSQEDFYSSLRGARVEVSGSGPTFTGRILALETRAAVSSETGSKPVPERRALTVIAESGTARTLNLTPITTVRLLDGALRTDLNAYLALLDSNRTEGVRHLSLTDLGVERRELRVSFLSEVPVWKSTYRILLTNHRVEQGSSVPTATLQGYSVVDNTTGEDWKNVQLSLFSGSPQSFLEPLAKPIYNRRPEIPVAANAQLTPQTHDSAITMVKEDGPPPAPGVAGMSGMAGAAVGGVFGALGAGSGAGIGSGSAGGMAGETYHAGAPVPFSQRLKASAAPMAPYETVARSSTVPNVATAAFDDFFAYNVTEPVTIPRNGSALVPILQTQLPTERVTLWSPSDATPLRALWLTNSSQLTLDRGSFSVVEEGAFAGEGLLETIHPGERRLISYAADQAVRVSVEGRHDNRRVSRVSIDKGVLRAENAEVADVDYAVTNAASAARTVIVEEPRRSNWTLDTGATPLETTAGVYRFCVKVAPKASAPLHIAQRHTVDQLFG